MEIDIDRTNSELLLSHDMMNFVLFVTHIQNSVGCFITFPFRRIYFNTDSVVVFSFCFLPLSHIFIWKFCKSREHVEPLAQRNGNDGEQSKTITQLYKITGIILNFKNPIRIIVWRVPSMALTGTVGRRHRRRKNCHKITSMKLMEKEEKARAERQHSELSSKSNRIGSMKELAIYRFERSQNKCKSSAVNMAKTSGSNVGISHPEYKTPSLAQLCIIIYRLSAQCTLFPC